MNINGLSGKRERNWKVYEFNTNFCLKQSASGIYIFGNLQNIYTNVGNVRVT